MTARCTCEKRDLGDGIERREWPDSTCPTHGFPSDQWYAGDPLRKHAKVVDKVTGEVVTAHEAWERCKRADRPGSPAVWATDWQQRFRDETPAETTARLLAERRVAT